MSVWKDIHDRSNGKTVRKEDDIHFTLVVDETVVLEANELGCIKKSACLPFKLGGYKSIDELLSTLGITVTIVPGIRKRTAPIQLWEAKVDLERKGDYKRAAMVEAQIRLWEDMSLRGLYDHAAKVIKLFPDEMRTEYNGKRMKELLVSTLAHEAMHAYFDRPGHDHLPDVVSVEEPMAEFGMLLYLHENQEKEPINTDFYAWAEQDVLNQKTCYRYGYALMQQHLMEEKAINSGRTRTRIDFESYKESLF